MASPEWAVWFAKFPSLPLPDEFALNWALGRIDDRLQALPSTSLSKQESENLRKWLETYKNRFVRDQKRPREGIDINGLVGTLSSLAGGAAGVAALGAAASGILAPLAFGFAAITVLTFARKEYRRHVLDTREELAEKILEKLDTILQKL